MKKLLTLLVLTGFVLAGPVLAQMKVGDWQVDPTSTNLVRIPHGTNDTLKTILEWLETNGTYQVSDLLRIAPLLDTDGTDDVTRIEDDGTVGVAGTVTDKGGGVWGLTFPSVAGISNTVFRSQIHGLWVDRGGDTNVSIRSGFVMCRGAYYATNLATSMNINTAGANVAGLDIAQICVDQSVSAATAPAMSFTNVFHSVTPATYDVDEGAWYVGTDRRLGALPMWKGALIDASRSQSGYLAWETGTNVALHPTYDWPCTGYWTLPTVSSADVLPAGCDEALIAIEGDTFRAVSASYRYWIGWESMSNTSYVSTYTSLGPTNAIVALCVPYASMVNELAWAPCPTNNLFMFLGEDDQLDDCRILVRGWREAR